MNPFARLEAACANVVERTFALAFPSALEPVQIARKLVAAFESIGAAQARAPKRFAVRVAPADFARFAGDRAYLERRWSAMLGRLGERSGLPQPEPAVVLERAVDVAVGTVAIGVETLAPPARLALRVRRGVPPNASIALARTVVVGRERSCDLVVVDPRVSRRHLEIVADGTAVRFRDLGSANGTVLNGLAAGEGTLLCGDVLRIGDSELVVEADGRAA